MKKVLVLANSSGGLYNFRIELIERLIIENYQVWFAVPQEKNDKYVQKIIDVGANHLKTPIDRRGMNPANDFRLIYKYHKIIKKLNPQIILTYTIKPNIYGSYIAKKLKVPSIMNITGMGTSLKTSKFKKLIKIMYKYAANSASHVFFQNISNKNFFVLNNLVSNEKSSLLPGSGVNIRKYYPVEKSSEQNLIKFLFMGRMMKDKGIDEYLEVAERIHKNNSNVEFQILGSYEEKKYIKKITQNNGVRYLGRSDDVRNEIKEIDCLIHPSYHEGMSNVMLEAGAMGKPLIASNIPGCKEIIDDKINGYLFESKSVQDLEKKVYNFIGLDKKSKEKMGKASREKIIGEFDREIVIGKYLKKIEQLVE